MKMRTFAIVVGSSLFASLSWAGGFHPVSAAPAMDEGGLVLLAVALVGTGLALMRGKR